MAEALVSRPAAPRPIPPQGWRTLNRDLARAVADLHGPASTAERLTALARLLALALVLAGGVVVYWALPAGGWGLAALLVAGVAYALLLIATHEMVHGTLLGCKRLEFGLGCLLSWPMAWPFATYTRLHNLHHRWNGSDGRDPERTQRLATDPALCGGPAVWLERHPFPIRCLLLGGIGLIVDTERQRWGF
ncbi:MAG: fatty acid desaturase [Cyanobacteriota bacterium]